MNDNQIINAVDTNFYTIGVQFQKKDSDSWDNAGGFTNKKYTYKVHDSMKLNVGDLVVVPSHAANHLNVVRVAEIHAIPDIDFEATYPYRWIVCQVSLDNWEALNERDQKLQAEINNYMRQALREKVLNALGDSVSNLLENVKDIVIPQEKK